MQKTQNEQLHIKIIRNSLYAFPAGLNCMIYLSIDNSLSITHIDSVTEVLRDFLSEYPLTNKGDCKLHTDHKISEKKSMIYLWFVLTNSPKQKR